MTLESEGTYKTFYKTKYPSKKILKTNEYYTKPGKKPGASLWNDTVMTLDVVAKASSTPEILELEVNKEIQNCHLET